MRFIVRILKIITFGRIEILFRILRRIRTRRIVHGILKNRKIIKLEIGAGIKMGENGWTTLDKNNACDLYWDLRNGIPFPDSSIDAIYSSHLFEHLPFPSVLDLLAECKRVLKPKGQFIISVPNAAYYIDAYVTKDQSFFEKFPDYYAPADNRTTLIDIINYIAYMDGEHQYMFDKENLLHLLKSKGFNNVKSREFDPELDSPIRQHESIYAEGSL
ncbi:MAG: methyltransferase domain-containing protein [Bacteroidales bacterium]|nr:methyltransferase domain-containing protein [Bacteroidales bacterium]